MAIVAIVATAVEWSVGVTVSGAIDRTVSNKKLISFPVFHSFARFGYLRL